MSPLSYFATLRDVMQYLFRRCKMDSLRFMAQVPHPFLRRTSGSPVVAASLVLGLAVLAYGFPIRSYAGG